MHNKNWSKAVAVLLGVTLAWIATGLHAQPAFRGASSASNSPAFRAASAASYAGVKFRGASSAAGLNASSLSINLPSGTVANDVMIAAIGVRPSSVTITPPTGWTLVRRTDNTNNSAATNSLAVYQRVAGASEPSSYAWDVTGSTGATGGIQAFAQVDTANPIDVEDGQATPYSLSHATPSVTTTVPNAMIVTAHAFATATTWSPPSGMTEAFDTQAGGQSIEANYVQQTATGATGTKTATASGTSGDQDDGNTHILALRPAAPVVTIDKPAGTVANDVMIASIGVRPSSATVTPPTGWTLVRRIDNNATSSSNSLAVYSKVAGGSEPASYAWDVTGAFGAVGGIQAFMNVDTANPINVENGQTTPWAYTHATPSVSTTVTNSMLVTAHSHASASAWTPPTGMSEGFDTAAGGQSIEANYVLQPPSGSTGVKTASASEADYGNTHILALRPAAPMLTIGRPTGTVANDVMIAAVGIRPYTASITPPAGWTLVRRTDHSVNGASNSLAVYRKVAGGAEPVSYTWDVTGVDYVVGGIQAFYNVDTANPIDVENGQATGYSLSHATPSITTTVPNAMIVTAHTFESASTWTPPAGMTEGFDAKFGGQSIEANYVLQPAAGATGVKTATAASDTDDGNTHILALRPGSAEKKLYFIHVDHLNTPRLIENQQGQAVWRHDQAEPFGSNPPNENPSGLGAFEFPMQDDGTYFDNETGMVYNMNRYRDLSSGRFIQGDPLGLSGGDLSLYVLRRNNPLSYTDPFGLQIAPPGGGAVGGLLGGSGAASGGILGGSAGSAGAVGSNASIAQGLTNLINNIVQGIKDLCQAKCQPATVPNIQAVLSGSPMLTLQPSVSASAIQALVSAIESGGALPPILADGNVIVDGNHRYIAGLLCGKPAAIQPWTAPMSPPRIPVRNLQILP